MFQDLVSFLRASGLTESQARQLATDLFRKDGTTSRQGIGFDRAWQKGVSALPDRNRNGLEQPGIKDQARLQAEHTLTSNPVYEPERWNTSAVSDSNNCYSYAMNDPDGHPVPGKPQPGEHAGFGIDQAAVNGDGSGVALAALADGLIPAPPAYPSQKDGHYLVALVLDPGQDYHWYRQDNDGHWSHKPGNDSVTNVDASGNLIANPETADRDYSGSYGINYTMFVGYFYVPTGGIKTGTPS